MHYIIILLISSLSLQGCNNFKNNRTPKTDSSPTISQKVEQQLVEVAQSIERSMATLALTQESHNPPLLNTAPLVTPEGGMGGVADIDWTGPIEPLIKRLAEKTDYRVKVLGKEPPIPVIVSITQTKGVIADILKNASLQAGQKASIMVFPATRIIELRYKSS